jgi:hypothetical protein
MEKKLFFVNVNDLGEKNLNELSNDEWKAMSEYSYTLEEYVAKYNDDYTYWQFPDRENYMCRLIDMGKPIHVVEVVDILDGYLSTKTEVFGEEEDAKSYFHDVVEKQLKMWETGFKDKYHIQFYEKGRATQNSTYISIIKR